jgi:TrpR-related protein YerC/YecD
MSVNQRLVNPLTDQLFDGILQLKTKDECYEFFEDLCTINELRDMSQRLEVARMLEAGEKYDDIEAKTGASTATISRVKRCLKYGADGYITVLARLGNQEEKEGEK